MRGYLLAFASLGVWGGWFLVAYGLHGFQCAGPVEVSRQAGQWVQLALWVAALAVCGVLVWVTAKWRAQSSDILAATGFWLNLLGFVAVIFTGAAIIYVPPC